MKNWFTSMASGKRDGFLAPALYVSIAIAIFVGITQGLTSAGVVGLDTGEMVTVWLWVAGLIVLLWIAYIIGRAYVTAKRAEEARAEAELQKDRADKAEAEAEQARQDAEKAHAAAAKASEERGEALAKLAVAREQATQVPPPTEPPRNSTNGSDQFAQGPSKDGNAGEDENAWVPPEELRYLDGSEHSVSTTQVFPAGCYLEPDSTRPTVDKFTGQQVYRCRILDLNPELKDRRHETLVNILADQRPFPSLPRFGLVKFDDLTITTYVNDRSPMRLRYSLRASDIHLAAPPDGRVPATWTASAGISEAATPSEATTPRRP